MILISCVFVLLGCIGPHVLAGSDASGVNALSSDASGTNPLVIKGYRFFDSVTGAYFGFRGVNYYPRPNTGSLNFNNLDLFTTKYAHIWGRDVPQFSALSANSIRLYSVDAKEGHDDFMCALQAEGIYVIVELGSSCVGCEITSDPAPNCYPASYKQRGEEIIQAFAKYDNVVGFSGGNEINHRVGSNGPEWNAACQKKFIRDMRAYIRSCSSMRQVPVGVVMADTNRKWNTQYYNCRTDANDELETVEWFGLNVYVQCDDISDPTKAAGFNNLAQDLLSLNYSVPLLLTEFGCLAPSFPTIDGYDAQRTFHDAKFMNSEMYTPVFGGGFVFEYSTELANAGSTSAYPFTTFGPQNYGLGYFSPENCDDVTIACEYKRMPNFNFLADAYMSTNTSSEPSYDTFTVESHRQKPSECPVNSPMLQAFQWAGDAIGSLSCPNESRHQCPNVAANRTPTRSKKSDLRSLSSSGSTDVVSFSDLEISRGSDDETDKQESSSSEVSADNVVKNVDHKSSGSAKWSLSMFLGSILIAMIHLMI